MFNRKFQHKYNIELHHCCSKKSSLVKASTTRKIIKNLLSITIPLPAGKKNLPVEKKKLTQYEKIYRRSFYTPAKKEKKYSQWSLKKSSTISVDVYAS